MSKELCKGCSQYLEVEKRGVRCVTAGIGSRWIMFRDNCCPCTKCLVKVACSWSYKSYPFDRCPPFKKARSDLFKLTLEENNA